MSDTAEISAENGLGITELKIAVTPEPKPPAITERDLLQLHQCWQTTLDPELLMNAFASELYRFVPHDSFEYCNKADNLHLKTGSHKPHRCSYKLVLEETSLGELELTREKRFSEDELYTLERTLSTVIHNLRNALNHRKALEGAYTDPLTGMLNRNALNKLSEKEIQRSLRSNSHFSILVIDIDHFKRVNDRLGHFAGDQVLTQVAQAIEANIRTSDTAFRHGGEEFIVLLPNTNLGGAELAGDKIRAAIDNMAFVYNGEEVPVTISLGATTMTTGDDLQSLTHKADVAMYQAKQAGRNCLRVG